MYRGRRLSKMPQKEAPESAAHAPEPAPAPSVYPMPATPKTSIHAETVRMKEKYTAPFMLYDSQARRIVANRQYDRALVAEMHRVQSIIVTQLRTPIHAHLSYTPKELLYELEAALYHVCASLAVQDNVSSLRHVLNDAEADPLMPQLESFLAHHNAPAKTVVALAHCLSEGTSHDVLTSFLQMLEQRVQQERDPAVDCKRSADERRALLATKNNLQDIAQLVRDVQTAYRSIDTASQALRRQPQSDPTEVDTPRSLAANAVPARIVEEAFYKVLRWVVAVDADRRALRAVATSTAAATAADSPPATTPMPETAVTPSTAKVKAFAKVIEYDPYTGHLTLERADVAQRWGLLLNDKGLLVGVENELRNSSEAGDRLYDAVQQQSGEAGGLAIFEVNRRRVRAVHMSSEEVASSRDDIMQKLRASLTQTTKTLSLTLERRKQADLTVPREVLFEVSYQGGEGGIGQRCLLMVERASTSISWGLKLQYLKGAAAVLSDFAPNMKLSNAAKNLLFDMRGRLRVLKVNNHDMAQLSVAEMKSLISGSLLLTLHLQVTDAKADLPPEAEATLSSQVERPLSSEEVAHAQETPAVDAAPSEAQKEAAAVAEAEAAADEPAEAKKMVSSAQGEIDDLADSIADEFLKQHFQEAKLEATASDKADAPAAEEGGAEAFEALEELHWARPTTTIGAPEAADDHSGDMDAEKDASLEQLSLQQHYKDDDGTKGAATGFADEETADHALMDGFKDVADGEDVPKAEESDKPIAEGEENAAEHGVAADVDAAEQEAKDGIEAAEDEAEAELPKKTRERKKAPAKTAKARAKKGEKNARGGGRGKKGGKCAADDGQGADDNEDASAQEAVEEDDTQLENFKDKEAAEVSLGRAALAEEAEPLQSEAAAGDAAIEGAEAKQRRGVGSKASAVAAATSEEDGRGAGAEEDTGAIEPDDSGKGSASAPVDMPLVDLPPTAAEVAIEHGRENTKKKQSAKADATEAALAAEDGVDDVARISLSRLLEAQPLTFDNDVRLEKFDGSTLELERSSTKRPWNIKVAFAGDDIIMTKLPPFASKQQAHPFLRSLRAGPQGEVKWVVDGLNGQDLSVMTKSNKTKALDAIKGSTKLSFVLRAFESDLPESASGEGL
ncbi:Tripartite attachment complex protein 102 / TAC102 [Leishmania donovani]|nr:Tripartite attachment complex protein 102 / TAC102 [Leishmania donovani]